MSRGRKLESGAQRQRPLRAEAADEGRCIRCRRGKPKKGRTTCEACLAEISALVALRRATLTPPMERAFVRQVVALADRDAALRDALVHRLMRKGARSAWPARRDAAFEALSALPKDVQRAVRRWARRSPAGGQLSVESPLYTQQLVAETSNARRETTVIVRYPHGHTPTIARWESFGYHVRGPLAPGEAFRLSKEPA